MKKQIRILLVIILVFVPLFTTKSGTYRHDTHIEKYLEIAIQDEFNCVGQVFKVRDKGLSSMSNSVDNRDRLSVGSCILIDSLHILSAAHCFIGEKTKDTVIHYNGLKVKTYITTSRFLIKPSNFSFFVMNQMVSAKKIICHPNYLKNNSCDIAIILLKKPIHGGSTIFLNRTPNELHDTVTGVGFGVSGMANEIAQVKNYSLKLAGQNIVDSIGGATVNGISTKLYADFDYPDERSGCNRIGDSKALELEYGLSGGDSGGPLFRRKNACLELVGIAAGTEMTVENLLEDGYYCTNMSWTRISSLYNWIKGYL